MTGPKGALPPAVWSRPARAPLGSRKPRAAGSAATGGGREGAAFRAAGGSTAPRKRRRIRRRDASPGAGALACRASPPEKRALARRAATRCSRGAQPAFDVASPHWPSDNNRRAHAESQFASPLVPIEIGEPRGAAGLSGPGRSVTRSPRLPEARPWARRRAARRGLHFPECPAAPGGAGPRPQPIRGAAGAAGERQVEPGRWAGARPSPRARPAACGQGVGRRLSRGGVRGRPSGSGCSRGAQPRAHLAAAGLRGRRVWAQPPRGRASLVPRRRPRAPSHGFRQFPPHPAPVYLREEKVPRI